MGRFKDLWNGPHKGFWRFVVIVTAIFIVWVGFVRHDNLVRWGKAKIELRTQNRRIEALQKEIDEMDSAINSLSDDKDTLERFARERFHFAEPGDNVYIDEGK
jgi:cell division protein FtsB